MRLSSTFLASIALGTVALLFSGCSSSFDPLEGTTPTAGNVGQIQGLVHGGQQSIAGAHVYLYSASVLGYGGKGIAASTSNASTSLLTAAVSPNPTTVDGNGDFYATSAADGSFSISGDYTCIAGTEVYLYVVGGNSGAATSNSGIGLMALLGTCPAAGNLATSVPYVWVNEVSTIAAAYAMAGFATDATHVGTTGSALAKTGIANAFATAANLVNVATGVAYATTPGGNGTVPQAEIDTLANLLAACVNTAAPTSTQCGILFANAESTGNTGAQPTDTATAAINIAHYPGTANLANLYGLQTGIATPFAPNLSAQPANFTISVAYTGGGLSTMSTQPFGMAADASGTLWIAAYAATVLCKFSPLGVPANANGYSGIGISTPYTLAIDANSTHVWIANYGGHNLIDFNITAASPVTYSTGTNSGPRAVAFDGSGNIWVPNEYNSSLLKMTSGGVITSTFTGDGIFVPSGLVIEPGPTGNIWVDDQLGTESLFSNSGSAIANPSATSDPTGPYGTAIDSSGNAWFASGDQLFELSLTGTSVTAYTPPASGANNLIGLAVDGGNNIWTTSVGGFFDTALSDNAVFEISNTGVNLSGSAGYVSPPTTSPDSLVLDGSGNVWYTSASDATLREIVGAAVPVVTPLAYAVANSLLGTRP